MPALKTIESRSEKGRLMSDLNPRLDDNLATPFVIMGATRPDGWRAMDKSTAHACEHHLELVRVVLPHEINIHIGKTLLRASIEAARAQLSNADPFVRFRANERLSLFRGKHQAQGGIWSRIRSSASVSHAFDAAMINRAASSLSLHPVEGAPRLAVDLGGGCGAYSRQLRQALGEGWKILLVDNYANAGWYAKRVEPRTQVLHVNGFLSPPRGAGLYFLGSVVHNLSDDAVSSLLHNIRTAAAKTSTLAILERPWEYPTLADSSRDIDMRVMFEGRERTAEEIRDLAFSSGWRFTGSTRIPGYVVHEFQRTADD